MTVTRYSNAGIGIQKPDMDGLFQSVAKRFNPLRGVAMRFKAWQSVVDRCKALQIAARYRKAPCAAGKNAAAFLRKVLPSDALFFQVRRFIEFYHPGDAGLAARLGLLALPPNRRGTRWGFPVAYARRYLLAEGVAVACVGETGRYLTHVQE